LYPVEDNCWERIVIHLSLNRRRQAWLFSRPTRSSSLADMDIATYAAQHAGYVALHCSF